MRPHALAVTFLSCLFLANVDAFGQRRTDPFKPLRFLTGIEEAKKAVGDQGRIPVIVTFNRQPTGREYQSLEDSFNGKFKAKYRIIDGAYAELTKGQINSLQKHNLVKRVELDFAGEYLLDSSTYWSGADHASQDFGVSGAGVTIAMIDSGIDCSHQDLPRDKILEFWDCRSGACVSDEPFDILGHGTMCSSVAAGEGHADPTKKGMAPGAAIVGFAVGDEYPFQSAVVAALDYLVFVYNPPRPANERVRAASFSFGMTRDYPDVSAVEQATIRAVDSGITIAASAGNSGPAEGSVGYNIQRMEEVIGVGGYNDPGEGGFYLNPSSSRGPTPGGLTKPDIIAPYRITVVSPGTVDEYRTAGGTSFSAPSISGTIALMLEEADNKSISLTPYEIKDILCTTAIDWGPEGPDNDYGWGFVDVYRAVGAVDPLSSKVSELELPGHFHASEAIASKRNADVWTLNVTNTTYPIAVTLIMPDWVDSRNPDFMLVLCDPSGAKLGDTRFTKSRQDTIEFRPTETGNYTIEIFANSGSGRYFFDVSAGASSLLLTKNDDGSVDPIRDLAILDISPNFTTPDTIDVFVDVANQGTETENAIVTLGKYIDENTSDFIGTKTLTLGPGQQDTVTFEWSAILGTHILEALIEPLENDVNVENNYLAEDVVVSDATLPELTVGVTTDKPSYVSGEWVQIEVYAGSEGADVEAAAVHVEVTAESGKVYGFDGTTDATGFAYFSYKIKKPDGTGIFTVDASASKDGYELGTGQTVFGVQ